MRRGAYTRLAKCASAIIQYACFRISASVCARILLLIRCSSKIPDFREMDLSKAKEREREREREREKES